MGPPHKRQKTLPKTAPVAEITFDFAAREEYLTGFHKRKLARAKHAQEEAAKKEKQEKVEARRMLRQQRKEDLERHVNEVNALLKQASGDMSEAADTDAEDDENEFQGFDEELPPPIDREEEYIDEDRYTTVTVESVDVNKSGFSKPDGEDGSKEDGDETKDADGKKRVWTKENPKKDRPKKRKVKFRYETKSERKITRFKERSKNRSQAKARRD